MLTERVFTPLSKRSAVFAAAVTMSLMMAGLTLFVQTGVQAETPQGFYSMESMMGLYPSRIIKEGDTYHVVANLDIPASKPLYMGPGTRVLFDENVYLNLTGAPLISGDHDDIVYMGPYVKGEAWGGINLMEGDPSASSIIKNATIEEAEIGIRSHSSDLRISDSSILNCSRNGMDIKGPMGTGKYLLAERIRISNSTYYGIHLLKVESSRLVDIAIDDCGTGIRTYRSDGRISGSEIMESSNIGFNAVDSNLVIEDILLSSEEAATSHQLLSLNSTISISDGRIEGANVGIAALSQTVLDIDGIQMSNIFTDGIQTSDADISILNSDLTTSGESGLHLVGTKFWVGGTVFNNNGAGTGEIVFSSIYSDGSSGKFEGCTFTGSGYAHIHSVSSGIAVGNSTLGSIFNPKLVLDEGSIIVMIDTVPPSDVELLDDPSQIIYQITLDVTTLEHPDRSPVAGVQVDLRDVDGRWIGSSYTGPDGSSRDITMTIYERDSTGIYSYLPINMIAQKDGYEVTSYDIEEPLKEVEVLMFPPNEGPSISLTGPVNGTKVTGSVEIEGDISDDLGIHRVRVRFDEGYYRTFDEFDSISGGHFKLTVQVGNLSGGLHTLSVHAFDGTHISLPEIRTIMVLDPRMNDSDEDGIPDIEEDVNGNGIVDQGETDPLDPDTDGDGLLDGIEIDTSDGNSTDPLDPDSDDDFLKDGFEDQNANGRVDPTETDPLSWDTDGDGVNDRDDHYPLDSLRSKDDEPSSSSIWIIILATLFIMGLIVAAYLFFLQMRGARVKEVEAEQDIRRARPGPRSTKDMRRPRRPPPRRR
ncbi:MAG: Ig-like domain-containing protein [Thermoplasmatota archaeon]